MTPRTVYYYVNYRTVPARPIRWESSSSGLRRRSPGRKRQNELSAEAAQTASERADAAKSVSEDGKPRVREANREGKQEVERRTQRLASVSSPLDQEREKAKQEVAERIERMTAEVDAESEGARAAYEYAQALIEDAHQQMAEARAQAAEATAAAQEAADQAHAHARAVAEKAEAQTGSASRVVKDARRAESALADEGGRCRTSRTGATQTPARLKRSAPRRSWWSPPSPCRLGGCLEHGPRTSWCEPYGVHLERDSVPDQGG